MGDTPGEKIEGQRGGRPGGGARQERGAPRQEKAPTNNAMASLFANAKQLRK
ncbi:hypothetical protein D9M71_443250 [compost metagenome]